MMRANNKDLQAPSAASLSTAGLVACIARQLPNVEAGRHVTRSAVCLQKGPCPPAGAGHGVTFCAPLATALLQPV